MGCDTPSPYSVREWMAFQSTHPHGVRLFHKSLFLLFICFNPRTHMGCDLCIPHNNDLLLVFQSTHPHGVRPAEGFLSGIAQKVSIHAPTWGATFSSVSTMSAKLMFQSTHPHGVRPNDVIHPFNRRCFNPRTHMGCDCILLS